MYRRYEDDILFCVNHDQRQGARELFWQLRRDSGYYKLELTSKDVGPTMNFLDCSLAHDGNGGIKVSPFFKPTSLMVPLSVESAHARVVHQWPFAYLRQIHAQAATYEDAILGHWKFGL